MTGWTLRSCNVGQHLGVSQSDIALWPMGFFFTGVTPLSRMLKKNIFALLSQCLVIYKENLTQTKIVTKISNFLHFKKIVKIWILIKLIMKFHF